MHQPKESGPYLKDGARGAWFGLSVMIAVLLVASSVQTQGATGVPQHETSRASQAARTYGTETFPCPPYLVPWVTFWVRIFTEFPGTKRVLHDSRYPWVIYEAVDVEKLSQAQITAKVQERREHYIAILDRLLGSPPSQWNSEEKRVASLLADTPDLARYTRARERIRSQPGISDRFREGLIRSGRYMREVEAILDSLGVPQEIAYLPHVESSFNPKAGSKAGAVGMWQFMGPTGRMYLRIDHDLDERFDVPAATEAAGRYLLRARGVLDSWPLAVISYNHGIQGMKRATNRIGTTDLVRILNEYDGPAFGFASRNFYCEFLAAIEAARRAEDYFGKLEFDPPEITSAFRLPQYVMAPALASAFGLTPRELLALNPALGASYLQGSRAVPKGYRLRLPPGVAHDAEVFFAAIPQSERFASRPEPLGYRVRPGDTLSNIARRHRVSVHSIMALNKIDNPNQIRAGHVLVLPDAASPEL